MNAVEIEEAISKLAEEPFDAAEFPFQFLEAFGNKETTIRRLRSGASNASDVPGGVLQRSNIHMAVCATGAVGETLKALRASPATVKAKAKFVLATDGDMLEVEELSTGDGVTCKYVDLPKHFGLLLPLAGISTVRQIKDNPIDIRATNRLNKLYLELLKENPDWESEGRRTDLNQFMARLIFCFFAEDTGIFLGEGLFTKAIEQFTASDSSNTHEVIAGLFRAMDTKPEDRKAAKLPPHTDAFPYVNGGLFTKRAEVPRFSRIARSYLLNAGSLNWKEINPDIFGSMIQAVADEDERGELGMHYTSVPNILKVLDPLFLDDLREKLEDAGDNKRKLQNLRKRLARVRVFDPACGSGNFLVISYRQMREIERRIIVRLQGGADTVDNIIDVVNWPGERSVIPLTNFYGIEIKSFAAEIARLALLIAEFQCDVNYIGQKEARDMVLPLHKTGRIKTGNALRLDWLDVCPPPKPASTVEEDLGGPTGRFALDASAEPDGETYICGNPPYKGGTEQNSAQKSDMKIVFDERFDTWKSFDYILGFFWKARLYLNSGQASAAFVTTNSVCQGEQVYRFWPSVITAGVRIAFCVTSFPWRNLAAKNAGVSVCIVGLSRNPTSIRFYEASSGQVREVGNINAYLVPHKDVYVKNETKPIQGLCPVVNGNKPADGGGLIFGPAIAESLKEAAPNWQHLIRPFFGAHDALHGSARYCLWVSRDDYEDVRGIPPFKARFDIVQEMRSASTKVLTKNGANVPYLFQQIRQRGDERVFQIPMHSSESRDFYPVTMLPDGAIVGNGAFSFYDPPLWNVAVFVSRLSLTWIAAVCGKIKTDFRFSNTLGWNTFPVPPLTENQRAELTRCAEDILLAREAHFPASIADLYDPENMPDDLRAAHDKNDETLERIYIGRRFKNDTERLEKLFDMYTKMTAKADQAPNDKKATKGAE